MGGGGGDTAAGTAAKPDSSLRMLSLAVRPGSPFRNYVAIKAHRGRVGEPDHGPALFFAGLPLRFDEVAVASVFGCFGDVEQVVMHPSQSSGMVLFSESQSVQAALQAAQANALVEWPLPEPEGPSGVKAWVHEHKALRPGNKVLQARLDEWVAEFDEAEARKEREHTNAMAEDGWTVVTRGKGRAKTTEDGDTTVRSGGLSAAAAKARGAAAGPAVEGTFYRFQARDKRRSELLELREQFENDRRRITELRQSRKFKPY
uniref:Ribosomal RNA-processing protein 7 C-terminal domain-containing protein n=1 Tax=Chlamydomonas euryale TaxID=1486919 RepID=A0A7R9VQG7_9CHLO